MFRADMTIDSGIGEEEEEEEEWVAPQTSSFFSPPVQQTFPQPAPFGVTTFPGASSWQFPTFAQPILQPDISTSSFISHTNPFLPAPTPSLPFMQNEPSQFLQASSFLATSSPSCTLGEPKKRKRRDRDMMVDSEEPSSPSERAQVKVVSKRMRMMKPFGSPPPFMLDKTEIVKDKTISGGPTLSIKVKTLSGKVMSLIVDPDDTIQELKEYLEEKSGVPAIQQRLIFRGKQVADTKTLADYKVETGSVLHLVLALRGGGD